VWKYALKGKRGNAKASREKGQGSTKKRAKGGARKNSHKSRGGGQGRAKSGQDQGGGASRGRPEPTGQPTPFNALHKGQNFKGEKRGGQQSKNGTKSTMIKPRSNQVTRKGQTRWVSHKPNHDKGKQRGYHGGGSRKGVTSKGPHGGGAEIKKGGPPIMVWSGDSGVGGPKRYREGTPNPQTHALRGSRREGTSSSPPLRPAEERMSQRKGKGPTPSKKR